jgi:NADH:quinone reductase (non-electrogenic)
MDDATLGQRPHVIILGGGFGGLTAAQALQGVPVRITLVDRTNHHLFQPLLYQVAMAGLSPADIATPIRSILRHRLDVRVLLEEASAVDLASRRVLMREGSEAYDFLIVSTGAQTSYFGHPEWAQTALGLKDLDDAVEIRRRVLLAFEAAEREQDAERQRQLLTFVVIGGGPTGVELAGALAELARRALSRDFRSIDPRSAHVLLLEAAPRILASFPERLAASALRQLEHLGAAVRTGAAVSGIDADGVHLGAETVRSSTVIWAAGVRATELTQSLGVPLDRGGRVLVESDLSVPGHAEVFAIGDAAAFLHDGGKPLPGVAPVAMQQGRFVARQIARSLRSEPRERFRYRDKGNLATIGRASAIADFGRIRLSGFLAWATWLFVHILYLVGYRNRVIVLINWFWNYITYGRGARLITGRRLDAGIPAEAAAGASLRAGEGERRDPEGSGASGLKA